jgi:hypothetical protein
MIYNTLVWISVWRRFAFLRLLQVAVQVANLALRLQFTHSAIAPCLLRLPVSISNLHASTFCPRRGLRRNTMHWHSRIAGRNGQRLTRLSAELPE